MTTKHPAVVGALIFLLFVGCVVVVLNGIALAVKVKKIRLSCNQYPYLWILLANILIGVFPLPLYGLGIYGFESTDIQRVICSAWRFSYFTCTDMATFSVVVMAVGRVFTFAPFLKPLKNSHLKRLSLSLWCFVGMFCIIPFFLPNNEDKQRRNDCHFFVHQPWTLFRGTALVITPYVLILGCYTYLSWFLTKNVKTMEQYLKSTQRKKSEMRIYFELKMTHEMLFVIGAFMLCHLPAFIYYTLEWTCKEKCFGQNYKPRHHLVRFIMKLLVLLHALFTPLIFVWRSPEFRRDFVKLFQGQASRSQSLNKIMTPGESAPTNSEL